MVETNGVGVGVRIGVRSQETGDGSQEIGVRRQESGVRKLVNVYRGKRC